MVTLTRPRGFATQGTDVWFSTERPNEASLGKFRRAEVWGMSERGLEFCDEFGCRIGVFIPDIESTFEDISNFLWEALNEREIEDE